MPQFFSSPLLLTDDQALSAASVLLLRQLGLTYSVDFSTVPNAALEPWDPVRIRYSDRYGPEVHVLRTVTIPLDPETPLTATTAEQTVILIGTVA